MLETAGTSLVLTERKYVSRFDGPTVVEVASIDGDATPVDVPLDVDLPGLP